MENIVPTSHPVDPSDPVILSKCPDESASSFRNSHFALRNSLFPAPTTDLDGLHELLASTQCITQRWLDKAKTKDEPPSIADISNLTLATRRIALLHRDIYKLENPGLVFPASKKSSPTHTPTQADNLSINDPDSSEFCNSEFAICNSPPTSTYPREVSRYVAAAILMSDKFDAKKAAAKCPDLYDEMGLMKSNPDYLTSVVTEMNAAASDTVIPSNSKSFLTPTLIQSDRLTNPQSPCTSPTPEPSDSEFRSSNFTLRTSAESPDPSILSKNSASASSFCNSPFAISHPPSENSVISVALCENSSDPVDPANPGILSKNSSSPVPTSHDSPVELLNSLAPRVLLAVTAIVLQGCHARAGPDDP